MKQIFPGLLVVFMHLSAFSQQAPIARVSSNGATSLHTDLNQAISTSTNDDILYLPGGTFQLIAHINKKITIIGVGHYGDSTLATGTTQINGDVVYSAGGSNSVLDGIYLTGSIIVIDSISGLKVFRSNVEAVRVATTIAVSALDGLYIKDCVIRNTAYCDNNTDALSNSVISNSFLGGNVYLGRGAIVSNSIFLSFDGGDYGFENNSFRDCIFLHPNGIAPIGYTRSFIKCSFSHPNNNNPVHLSCYYDWTAELLFGHSYVGTFNYAADYYKLIPSLAGSNGQIGVFGGVQPYKEGAIPPTPHIRSKNVDATTGPNGTLKIRFNVSVQ